MEPHRNRTPIETPIETEGGRWLPGAGGKGSGTFLLMGSEFLFGKMKKFWRGTVGVVEM